MDKVHEISDQTITEESSGFKRIINKKNLSSLLSALIFLNILILDILLLQGGLLKTGLPQKTQSVIDQTVCPQACIEKINRLETTINVKQNIGNSPTPVPTFSQSQAVPQVNQSPSVKEFYVPFGSGSGSSSDWQDISGLQAYIDSSSYGAIKNVIFEASLHIPTGNESVSVRLYNATDGHPVWNSQIDFAGSTQSVFLASQPVNLDPGNKLYTVQMKTQLQYSAVLDQSRIHITTN